MVSQKKIDFLAGQGFDREIINLFINCGVDKHLLWFLGVQRKGEMSYLDSQEIRMVNSYLEKNKNNKDSYNTTLEKSRIFQKNEERKNKNKLYTFKNGYYISLLNESDLKEEAAQMSNCVYTHFRDRVLHGEVGIIALKQPSTKTVAHIEIFKNGLIGQNYAKANTQMSKDAWMMVYEFFEKNSKKIDLDNLFGESYVASYIGEYVREVALTIPTAVQVSLRDGKKQTEQVSGFEVKRFIPYKKHKESAIRLNSKEEVLNWIIEKKKETENLYDDLYKQVSETSAKQLFLSDEIKEKIFGSKKGGYFLKGDDYNMSELDPNFQNRTELVDEPMGEEERPVDRAERANIGRIRQAVVRAQAVGQPDQPEPAEAHAPEMAAIAMAVEELAVDIDAINEVVNIAMERAENQENNDNVALVEDENGEVYEVNVNDIEEVGELPVEQPRHFNELLNQART